MGNNIDNFKHNLRTDATWENWVYTYPDGELIMIINQEKKYIVDYADKFGKVLVYKEFKTFDEVLDFINSEEY